MIYHQRASLSEQHTDLLIICHCTKQDLSQTSRYVDKSSPAGIAYVCQHPGQLLSVHKLSLTLKSWLEVNFWRCPLPEVTSTPSWSKFVLPVGNWPLMICSTQGVSCHVCFNFRYNHPPSAWAQILKCKCAHLKFLKWLVQASKKASKHTHACAQWSHTSVGLAQAHPNYISHLTGPLLLLL